jgi:hypothetical protein
MTFKLKKISMILNVIVRNLLKKLTHQNPTPKKYSKDSLMCGLKPRQGLAIVSVSKNLCIA